MILGLRTYGVSRAARQPLLDFMVNSLRLSGCRMIYCSGPIKLFVISFETAGGDRMGIVAQHQMSHRKLR